MIVELTVFWLAFGASVNAHPAVARNDKELIRRYIREELPQIERCYLNELNGQPDLEGTVTTYFTIGPTGRVQSVFADGVDEPIAGCVAGVIRAMRFPKPFDGDRVNVTYPFTFRAH
jgi:hypothetical protein